MKKLIVIVGYFLVTIINGCSSDTSPDGTKLTLVKHKKYSNCAIKKCKQKKQNEAVYIDS